MTRIKSAISEAIEPVVLVTSRHQASTIIWDVKGRIFEHPKAIRISELVEQPEDAEPQPYYLVIMPKLPVVHIVPV